MAARGINNTNFETSQIAPGAELTAPKKKGKTKGGKKARLGRNAYMDEMRK